MGIENLTTSANPSKSMPGCGCGPGGGPTKADLICELLEDIKECLTDIKIGDVSINVDLTEVKGCLDDILACLNVIKVDIKELCTKVANLETLLEANNVLLADIKKCITAMHEEIVACLKDLKASNVEIVDCLKELKLSNTEIVDCLKELKLSNTEIVDCLKELKLSNTEIVDCLKELKLSNTEIVDCLKELKLSNTEVLECLQQLKLDNVEIIACLKELKIAKENADAVFLWGKRIDCNTVDNHSVGEPRPDGPGIVAWPQDDHEVTFNLSDGTTCVQPWLAVPLDANRWLASNTALAAAAAKCGKASWAFAASAPDGNPNTAWGGHAEAKCCPGDVHIVSATAVVTSKARNGRVIPLATAYVEGEVEKYMQFVCKGQPDVWTDMDGNVIEKPDLTCTALNCQFPAADPCGCPVPVNCSTETFQGCLIQNPEDEETGVPTVVQQNVFQRFETCDGVTTIINFVIVGEDEEPVEIADDQYFGDCDTLLPPNYEPPCPPDCDWQPMSLVAQHATWENTNYVDPTVAAVKAGDTIEITFADGSTHQMTIVKNSLFEPKAYFESLGCAVKVHCDNWVINGEDRCLKFPAWPTGKDKCPAYADLTREDVYAAYIIITHCDPSKLPVSTEIIASPREGVVGATHHSVACETSEMVSACITCGGTIVKDCDNKIIDVDPKCLMAPKTEVCDLGVQALLESVKGTKSGSDPVEYSNTDDQTELDVSVGSNGDVKITSGNGDGSDEELTVFITNCLAEGKNVAWEATGVGGESASGTLLAAAQTNPFPNFYNQSTDATPAISFKVASMTASCDGDEVCFLMVRDCNSDAILACLEVIKEKETATIEECCTGGSTATTAKCASISASWTTMSLGDFDTCTASFGGIDLPNDNYDYADFEALIVGVGGTIEPDGDRYKICLPEGFTTCYQRACFKDRIGQLTRACVVSLPNTTEPECIDFQRTWGKYEEPIANILQTQLAVQEEMLAKQCEIADNTALSAAKLCLIEAHTNPATPCPDEVPPEGLNKELQTLTIPGDVSANYPAGQSINLQNANGEACGTGTVGETAAVFNAETNATVITLVECELEEGKTAAAITQATAVTKTVVKALTAVKTLTKTAIKVTEPVKEVIVKEAP